MQIDRDDGRTGNRQKFIEISRQRLSLAVHESVHGALLDASPIAIEQAKGG
jgi:hypothetical protein